MFKLQKLFHKLFNKLLFFIVFCLAVSGGIAFFLIKEQITEIVYEQTQRVFESDFKNVNTFLIREKDKLIASSQKISTEKNLLISVELEVLEEVQKIITSHQILLASLLNIDEVLLTDPQGRVISQGYDVHTQIDPMLMNNAFGIIEKSSTTQFFSQSPLYGSGGEVIGHVVLIQGLSENPRFFADLKKSIEKEAILFIGEHQVGVTFDEELGEFGKVEGFPELFTAAKNSYIGMEREFREIYNLSEVRVAILQSMKPLAQYIEELLLGTVVFIFGFVVLIGFLTTLFFTSNIRRPLNQIQTGIEAIRDGNLDTQIHLEKKDEWAVIEGALNSMTARLKSSKTQLENYSRSLEEMVTQRTAKLQQSLEETKRKEQEISHINQVIRTVNATLELDQVMQTVLSVLQDLFPFNQIGIWLIDTKRQELQFSRMFGSGASLRRISHMSQIKIPLHHENSWLVKTIRNNEPGYVSPISDEMLEYFDELDRSIYEIILTKSLLLYPLEVHNTVIGVIVFGASEEPFHLEETDIYKIQRYIIQIATAVNNARLAGVIREKQEQMELLASKLAKYLSPQVYESIFSGEKDVKIETYRKRLTVFFSDIVGFTSKTEQTPMDKLTRWLNNYLEHMATIAIRNDGTLDKFIGDAVMVFFGDPQTSGEKKDAIKCVLMAMEMRDYAKLLGVDIRIGVNTGDCIVGNFGSEQHMEYTIIGGAVNLTARLETNSEANKILISDTTFELVKDVIRCKPRGGIHVKGINREVMTYWAVEYQRDLYEHLEGTT